MISQGQITITDLRDITPAGSAPVNPVADQLWMDTSVTPNILKRWNGSGWVPAGNKNWSTKPTTTDSYTAGDLWTGATVGPYTNDILKCVTSKAAGADFSIAHWELASKYTDDTTANAAKAYTDALADDSKITPDEKPELKQRWDLIVSEGAPTTGSISKQAIAFNISTSTFDTAYSNLNTYLNAPDGVFANMATIKEIYRPTWDSRWKAYYNQRTALMNAISTAAKAQAISAAAADATAKVDGIVIGGRNTFISSQRNISAYNGVSYTAVDSECPYGFFAVGDQDCSNTLRIWNVIKGNGYWTVSWEMRGSQNAAVGVSVDICDAGGVGFSTTADNSWKRYSLTVNVQNYGDGATYNFVDFQNFAWACFYIRNIKVEKGNKPTDFTEATEEVQAKFDDMAADGKLTPVEKQSIKKDWLIAQEEYYKLSDQCTTLGVSNSLSISYTDLANAVNPVLASMTTTSDIDRNWFNGKFAAYSTAKGVLQNALTNKVQANVDNKRVAARNYLLGSRCDSISGWNWSGGYAELVTDAKMGNVVKYSRPAGGGDFQRAFGLVVGKFANSETVYYCIAKSIGVTNQEFCFGGWTETFMMLNHGSKTIDLGNGWKMYYSAFMAGSSICSGGLVGLNSIRGEWLFHSFGVGVGNTPPTDYTEAPEDVAARIAAADAKAQAAKDKTDSLNYIDANVAGAETETIGGLTLGNIMAVRDGTGTVTAGMNGINTSLLDVRFWAGANFANRNKAPFRVYEDGSIELENLFDGYSISLKQKKLDSLDTLLSQLTMVAVPGELVKTDSGLQFGWHTLTAPIDPGEHSVTYEKPFRIDNYSKLRIIAAPFVSYRYKVGSDYGNRILVTNIVNTDTGVTVWSTSSPVTFTSSYADYGSGLEHYNVYTLNTDAIVYLPTGNYKAVVKTGVATVAVYNSAIEIQFECQGPTMTYRAVPNRTMVAPNGIAMIADETNYMAFLLDGLIKLVKGTNVFQLNETNLKYTGATDMPGVLFSGSVVGGIFSNTWGAKKSTGSITNTTAGTYVVPIANMTSAAYVVQVTPQTAGYRAAITGKSSTTFAVMITNAAGTAANGNFDFLVTGNN